MFGIFAPAEDRDTPVYFHNSATRTHERFAPIKNGQITMYSCGPTVYDYIHIGNLRAYLVPDLVRRLFLYRGYNVRSTINVTDFGHLSDDGDDGEDKMMKGMQRDGYEVTLENMRAFAEPYIDSFKKDFVRFGNLKPSHITRASDYVRQQISLIETLVQKGYAYETSDGVYFDISTFPSYGVLGNVDLEALRSGARVTKNPEKRHPADFALWKKGELGWKSKWGLGFPGWHIECTAMAFATLGKEIDIHTGGEDLMYTHHNGEIAQAEAITHKPYVHYWLHNAHITIDDEKVSKSIGNTLRLDDLIARGFSPIDYRYWLLTSHYRSPANFSFDALTSAQQALTRLRRLVYEELAEIRASHVDERYEQQFLTALSDDLDTPQAIAVLFELAKDTELQPAQKLATIHALDSLLGLGLSKPVAEGQKELGIISDAQIPADIQKLLGARETARSEKNWEKADACRDEIVRQGYQIEDTPDGPRVSRQ